MTTPSPQDDEHTVIRTGPTSGLVDATGASASVGSSLPEGLKLGEYEIKGVIGEGGFGIVYLAYDHFLQRQVALKEYMPSALAGRARTGLEVTIKSDRHRDTFMAGLKSFINEARLLAQFDHPALVKVYRFWEGNGTAYMVMPYVVGPTLKDALAQLGRPPTETWLRHSLLAPLLEALALLHKSQCLHRDIAPDNILLTDTGPMLLDFGAARKVIGDLSQNLTVVLKPGYAPIEQYGEAGGMTQGPWTDLYALAGVVRYAITGKVPPSATTRLIQDTMVPLAKEQAGKYDKAFLAAVDTTLQVRPEGRPQNVAAFQAMLGLNVEARPSTLSPTLPVGLEEHSLASPRRPDSSGAARRPRRPYRLLWLLGALAAAGAAVWLSTRGTPEPAKAPMPPAALPASASVAASQAHKAPLPPPAMPPATVAPKPAVAASPAVVASSAVLKPPASASKAAPPARSDNAASVSAIKTPPAPVKAVVKPAPRPEAPPPLRETGRASEKPARCSDILQKASLEPLTPSETQFLKSECR